MIVILINQYKGASKMSGNAVQSAQKRKEDLLRHYSGQS